MRSILSSILLATALLGAAACGDDSNGGDDDGMVTGTAKIRVIHASPDAPAVDVYVAGSTTPVITDLAYGETSPYLEVDAGTYTFEVRAAGADPSSDPAYSTGALELTDGAQISALAEGYLGSSDAADKFRVTPLAEGFTAPGAGKAVVRIVHASPDAPTVAIDVGNDGSPEIEALDRFADTGAPGVELPAGQALNIGIWAGEPLARVTQFTTPALPDGAELFVIASGNLADLPRQDTGFALLAVGDGGTIATIKQDPTVYVLHASPDAPAVDVKAGDATLVGDLAFGELSAPVQVPPGSYDLDINAAGTATTAATITTPDLAAGERYLTIATGFLGATGEQGFQPLYVVDELAVDDAGARVGAVHASPDAPAVDIGPATAVQMGANPPIAGLAFAEQVTGEGLALPAGALQLGLAAAGSTTPVVTWNLNLAAGQRSFLVAAGALSPEQGQQAFRLIAVNTQVWPWVAATVPPAAN